VQYIVLPLALGNIISASCKDAGIFSFSFGLGLLDDHDGAVRVVRAVVADAPQQRPLDGAVAVAAHHQQVRAVLLRRAAQHGPGLPFHHLDEGVHRVGDADAARPVDHGLRHLAQVGLHVPDRLAGSWSIGREHIIEQRKVR